MASHLVNLSTTETETTPEIPSAPPTDLSAYMAAMGRKGGKIGGKRRLMTLTARERKKIATNAAKARWNKAQKLDQA